MDVQAEEMSEDDVRELLKQRIATAGSQYRFAVSNRLREDMVSKVRRGLQAPSQGLLVALGLKKVTVYEPIK